ncbi:unnamed protein product [[Actinomadura] parvosata subsp. kistnae]|uniref:DUF1360 domain-containing protein n=1 Tax=[Actinomadura] parvosata subsp. kistnae TaxID=1909395 RepID=A0A1V0AGH4_9ACTN|nr:DUF1360 domain-containing protein [Nonomuraea sp. ATCC 55076]AQZ69279.1 hypothetical protein BKM31_54440 [Nonomuraea sp. ATCC 55076]SPL92093.1 unnamed protein product [Actinomadura parvosata subsp. kistnae]
MTDILQKTEQAYENGHDRPLGGYVGLLVTYGGTVGVAAAVAMLAGRKAPEQIGLMDLALMAACTHKVSRRLAKDPVTSPLRAPFTRYEGQGGPSEVQEKPRGAIGELLACPFCLAQWVATAYAAGLVLAPRVTRLVGATMTAVAVSDWLQFAYAKLMKSAEE